MPPVDFMADFCARAAYYFGLPCTGPVPLPRRTERWTVIKSPFIFKKQMENFERRTYSRLVTIKDGHPDVVEMWLSYCVRNMFHGTGMKAHIFTHDYVGVGKTMTEDIKQLIETDRWSVDGFNTLHDNAEGIKGKIDQEILRIESQLSERDSTERARRILQLRVDELLQLEEQAKREAQQDVLKAPNPSYSGFESEELQRQWTDRKLVETHAEKMQSMVQKLPQLDVDNLENEVKWDKQQDEALRKHLLHVGKYAQQKGKAPLTREEYFVYVPRVLLPKYMGIHKDVFEALEKLDLLRIPDHNNGYLADWDGMSERQRYDAVIAHRKRRTDPGHYVGDHMDTSRLSRIVEKRRSRRAATSIQGVGGIDRDEPGSEYTSISVDDQINQNSESGPSEMPPLDVGVESVDTVGSGAGVHNSDLHVAGSVAEMTGDGVTVTSEDADGGKGGN
jgi:ribosomal protein S10